MHRPRNPRRKKAAGMLPDDFVAAVSLYTLGPPFQNLCKVLTALITATKPVSILRGNICEIDRNPVESTAPVACPTA